MAAGTNWKRPWEDDHDRGHVSSSPASYTGQSAPSTPSQTPPGQDGGRRFMAPRNINLVPTQTASSVQSPDPRPRAGFVADDTIYRNGPGLQPFVPISYKRQRLGDAQLDSPISDRYAYSYSNNRGLTTHIEAPSQAPSEGRRSCNQTTVFGTVTGTTPDRNIQTSNQRDYSDPDGPANAPSIYAKSPCRKCALLDDVVPRIVDGVDRLHGHISSLISTELIGQREAPDFAAIKGQSTHVQSGLRGSLEWGLERLNASIQMARNLLTQRLCSGMATRPPSSYDGRAFASLTPGEKLREERWDREDAAATRTSRVSPRSDDDGFRVPMPLNAPPTSLDDFRKEGGRDPFPYMNQPADPLASSSSAPVEPQFPMQGPAPHRLLPSPSSLSHSNSSMFMAPVSPSLALSKSPHTAHLQELQHQISTKSLAHQILQGEHDKLLAAFSRSQTRCGTLEKKSQVSDNEINNLVEERMRLQTQVDLLELQVEDLQHGKDEAHKRSVADSMQHMQIMAMSTTLQAQGAADLKRWKAERAAWQLEKDELLSRIVHLERSGAHVPPPPPPVPAAAASPPSCGESAPDVLSSTSVDLLRAEILRLRGRRTQPPSETWQQEIASVDEIVLRLDAIRTRMRMRSAGHAYE